jgi:sulfoquinovosidase
MHFETTKDGFALTIGNRTILSHSFENPAFFAGFGKERMDMYRGNFDIEDYLIERNALRHAEVSGDSVTLSSAPGQAPRLRLTLDGNAMRLTALDDTINRLWLRVVAETDEHVWGGG